MKFAGTAAYFTLSKPTEGVKLLGAAAGGATVNGSTLWRHPFLIPCIRLYMQRIWGFLFQFT